MTAAFVLYREDGDLKVRDGYLVICRKKAYWSDKYPVSYDGKLTLDYEASVAVSGFTFANLDVIDLCFSPLLVGSGGATPYNRMKFDIFALYS